jgi:hypothetical protein
MEDSPAVGVGHRVAHAHERTQQLPQFQAPRRTTIAPLVVSPGGLGEGAAADETHGVEGLLVGAAADLVDRHDAGVLQLSGHLRLTQEARPQSRLAGAFGS